MHESEQARCTARLLQMACSHAAGPPLPAKAHWPARRLTAKTAPQGARLGVQLSGHDLVQLGEKHWRCRHCLRDTASTNGPLMLKPCGEGASSIACMGKVAHTHRLYAAVLERGPLCVL